MVLLGDNTNYHSTKTTKVLTYNIRYYKPSKQDTSTGWLFTFSLLTERPGYVYNANIDGWMSAAFYQTG